MGGSIWSEGGYIFNHVNVIWGWWVKAFQNNIHRHNVQDNYQWWRGEFVWRGRMGGRPRKWQLYWNKLIAVRICHSRLMDGGTRCCSLSPSLSLWVATICGLTRTGQLGSRGALEGNPSTLSCENGEFQFQKQRNMSSLLHIHPPPPLVIVDVVLTCMSMLAEVGGCIIKHTRALRLNWPATRNGERERLLVLICTKTAIRRYAEHGSGEWRERICCHIWNSLGWRLSDRNGKVYFN